ncbi:hypothetical protein [Humibacter sp.]|jgi:hypothetical protein|uniref:hypothetical protein n=1 Tax=Humibacter sp. TaxID=1940291 RepID=UPI002B926F9A|nr:hypothetical protein [Humibacter sp.]HVX08317.1 hypothetical protein [Humibacter sp.]
MSLRRRMPAVALAALVALALAACTPAHPRPTPSSSPAATPLFSSDAEALKAATDAYAAYLKVSDEISHDGGANPERIKPYVTTHQYQRELKGFDSFRSKALHTTGSNTFDSMQIGNVSGTSIDAYVCFSSVNIHVLNDKGEDVTPSRDSPRIPFELAFDARDKNHLLLSRSDIWSGHNFC